MPISFRVLPERALTVLSYSGFIGIAESVLIIDQYLAHPDFSLGQKFLFDTTAITGYEKDYVKFMHVQAKLGKVFLRSGHDQLVGCVAPHEAGLDFAMRAKHSWSAFPHLVPLIHEDEAEVLRFLGQPEHSIGDMFAHS